MRKARRMAETRMGPTAPPDPAPYRALAPRAEAWFRALQARLCAALEAIEQEIPGELPPQRFAAKAWTREDPSGAPGGGGEMRVLREGRHFEKAGVNVSAVAGTFSPEFAAQIPGAAEDPRFYAAGISVVIHPRNPFVPAAHMNTRLLITRHGWFGGGADLTPMLPETAEAAEDAHDFHAALEACCARFDPTFYPRFKAWCDRYFFLPHRGETRGAGGIFFDDLTREAEADFAFIQAVGATFAEIYPALVRRRALTPYGAAERERQLIRRGRYVEFNLLYDRGTLFGLKTGGNVEAILMSLPPLVRWP